MDKIILCHQLFLIKNIESKKVKSSMFYFSLCPFSLIFRVYSIALYAFLNENMLYKNFEAAIETKDKFYTFRVKKPFIEKKLLGGGVGRVVLY